jgi:transcriptional regulator with XRE-family HTH domain
MAVFGEILKRLRQEKSLSQQELANLIGVHVRQVSKYEMGTSMPTLDRIRRMAETLEVSADELVFGASKRRAATNTIKHPVLAERLRTLEQMVSRDELRSVIELLDAFIAKKQIDQISRGRTKAVR